jgi:hypothetical protein
MTNSNEDRLIEELTEYYEILEKLRQDQAKELNKESEIPSKPVALSNLKSPISNSRTTSSNELDTKLKYCVDCIIEYGRRTLP